MKLLIKSMMMISLMMVAIMGQYEKDSAIEDVREDFYKATSMTGNEEIAEKVLETLQKIVEEKYTATRASYLGSITSKMADYSFFPWTKMSYAEDGSKMLNQSIKEEPNNVDIRLNRINSYLHFPDFLKKGHYVQQDARWLIKNIGSKHIYNDATQSVYDALAKFFAKEKDEKRYNKYFSKLTNQDFIKQVQDFKKSL